MNQFLRCLALLLFCALVACDKKVMEDAPIAVEGEVSTPGSAFAYEHRVGITLPEATLGVRMLAVREACTSARIGACHLLAFETRPDNGGTLRMRVAPSGVESLVALAGEGGALGSRATTAEDLAPASEDIAVARDRLQRQRDSLVALPGQGTLGVADHVALSGELARIDSELAALERRAAQVARRVETNLLTIDFVSEDRQSAWTELADTLADAPESLAYGIAEAIDWLAFGVPILLVGFPLALLWRALWRRVTRPSRRDV